VPRFICQIYEVQDPAEAEQLVAMGVDHIGSVLLPEEAPSNIRIAETITAVRRTGAVSSLIPLFSDTDRVLEALARYQPDIVHFCEILELRGEGRDYIETLVGLQRAVHRVFPRMRIMRSIPIGPPGCADLVPTLALAECFAPVSDLFLTDTLLIHDEEGTDQPVSGFVGITGRICDWDMARRLVVHSPLPVILPGTPTPHYAGCDPGASIAVRAPTRRTKRRGPSVSAKTRPRSGSCWRPCAAPRQTWSPERRKY